MTEKSSFVGLYPHKQDDDKVVERLEQAHYAWSVTYKTNANVNLLTALLKDAKLTIERLQEDLDCANSEIRNCKGLLKEDE